MTASMTDNDQCLETGCDIIPTFDIQTEKQYNGLNEKEGFSTMKKSNLLAPVLSLAIASLCTSAASADNTLMTISAPNIDYAVNGDTVEYEVNYSDDTAAVNLTNGHIGLYGFTGNLEINGNGNRRTITISDIDIQSEFDEHGYGEIYLTVNAGTGIDENGSLANGVKSEPIRVSSHPYMTMALRENSVKEGDSITVDVTYRNSYDRKIKALNLTPGHVGLYGFTGNIYTSSTDNYHSTIIVDNIVDKDGENYITLNAGTCCDENGNLCNGAKSSPFEITESEYPLMTMGKPYASADGNAVCVDLTYSDDVTGIDLRTGSIGLYGFTGDISIDGEGNVRTISVSNIKVTDDILYISVNSGTGFAEDLHLSNGCKSHAFTLGDGMKKGGSADDKNPPTGVSGNGAAAAAMIAGGSVIAIKKRKKETRIRN